MTHNLTKLILLSVLTLTSTFLFSQATLVKDINPGASGSSSQFSDKCTCVNDKYFFLADDGSHGKELWVSDGTEGGTTMVKDINEGATSTSILELTVVGDLLYFLASTADEGSEPWISDGTEAGTFMLKDINTGTSTSNARHFTPFNNMVYFTAIAPGSGLEIWMTDGTTAGTQLAFEIAAGNNNDGPQSLNVFDGNLYFWSGHSGNGFYRSDGTAANTVKLADIEAGSNQVHFPSITVFDGKMVFAAETIAEGTELWVSDGTAAGTMMLADIFDGSGSSYPRAFHEFQGSLYFGAGADFWKTDGTPAGTEKVAEPNLTSVLNESYNIVSNDNYMFFWGKLDLDKRLWGSDGTTAGTMAIDNQVGAFLGLDPKELAVKDGVVYFIGDTKDNGVEVAYSQGEVDDVQLVSDIQTGSADSDPFCLRVCGEQIFFYAEDAANGEELFVANQTTSIRSITNQTTFEITLMPNPVGQTLTVEVEDFEDTPFSRFDIFSVNGTLVKSGVFNNKTFTIDVAPFSSGIYFIRLSGENINVTDYFVKE